MHHPLETSFGGACTHCHYAGAGTKCSFKIEALEERSKLEELEDMAEKIDSQLNNHHSLL